ncbi:PDZ domain-containing protein, partial [Trichonephila inaurata madagascariensis]
NQRKRKSFPPNQAGPLSPGTPGTLAPARPGTKLTNIVDITLSPTFQMIQEVENRSGSPLPEQRTPTLPRRAPGPAPGPKPFQEQINSFGVVIHPRFQALIGFENNKPKSSCCRLFLKKGRQYYLLL